MSTEQTKKPYKFSFPDPWDDADTGDTATACDFEPPMGSAPEEPLLRERQALNVVSGSELADMRLDPVRFCVEGLLPEGCPFWAARQRPENPGWCWISASKSQEAMPFGAFRRRKATCFISASKTVSTASRTG